MAEIKIGDTAPEFATVDDKNAAVKLSDLRGKRVVLYFYRLGQPAYVFLTMVALAGALMVSYTRARAENTVLDCKVGFAERGERMVLMLLGLFLHKLGAAMWMLAFLAWLTTLQRLVHTYRALEAGQQRAPAEPAQG